MKFITQTNNSFFFLIDTLDVSNEKKILNVNSFFRKEKIDFLSSVKYFLFFSKDKIDFFLLEKNYKLIFFFNFFNKLFFKDQIKNLKLLFNIEKNNLSSKVLHIKFYLNFYFFFKHIISFTFILKFVSLIKSFKRFCINVK